VLGDIGVRLRRVRVPIIWQSVALRDAASVEPVLSARFVLEIPLQLDRSSIRITVAPG
jgi:hypothetical protein